MANENSMPLIQKRGWKSTSEQNSLQEVYRSLRVPKTGSWFRKFLAFVGPGYLVDYVIQSDGDSVAGVGRQTRNRNGT